MEKKINFVFITTNLLNKHQYVGEHSTNDINCKATKNYLGSGRLLLKKTKQYGSENFERKILEFFPTKQEAFDAQAKYIRLYKTHVTQGGYNKDWTGGHNVKIWNEESRKKISKIQTGKKHSEEWKKHHSEVLKGKKHSEETRKKQSESMIGKNVGKKRTAETRKKQSESRKGKKDSNETRQKKSNATKGKNNPMFGKSLYIIWMDKFGKEIADQKFIEYCKKIKGRKLKPFSEEHKKNLKIAKIGYIPAVKGIGFKQLMINAYGEEEGLKRYELFRCRQRDSKLGKKIKNRKSKPLTQEHKDNISKSLRGKKHNLKEVECPYCKLRGRGGNMTRYHFNNCKYKNHD